MGFLPIFLAMAGFVVLWGIVSSNSIKTRKQEAESSAFLVFEQASIRNEQFLQLYQQQPLVSTPDSQPFLAYIQQQNLPATSDAPLLAAQQVRIALPDLTSSDTHQPQGKEAYEQLQLAQQNLQQAARLFNVRLKQYNDLVGKYPTLLVARLMGYHPVKKRQPL